ncbi:hypothetical protein LSAT2_016610 [Lamellibrachia satsuma]|nr:hypothetical protein LSAT2_016610 [Lamellibrachia satsuma]
MKDRLSYTQKVVGCSEVVVWSSYGLRGCLRALEDRSAWSAIMDEISITSLESVYDGGGGYFSRLGAWSRTDVFADDETVERLCRGLEGMTQLKTLDLSRTGLTNDGFTRICQTVTSNCRQLTYLNCRHNPGLTDGVEGGVRLVGVEDRPLRMSSVTQRLSTTGGRVWSEVYRVTSSDDEDSD